MTPRVDFYVLTGTTPADKHHTACRLAAKAHAQGMKVYLQTDDAAASETLNQMLWTFAQNSFVPHAIYNGENGDPLDPEKYPVQIGTANAPDGFADLLISLRQDAPADYAKFTRIAELIANNDTDKTAGRNRFRFYREQGTEPQTHQVSP